MSSGNGQIDVIIAKKAIEGLELSIKKIDEANAHILTMSKSVRELNTNLSAVKTPADLETRLKKNAEAQETIVKSVEKVRLAEIKLAKDREQAFDKFEKAQQKANKARVQEANAIASNKAALDKQRKSMMDSSRAYRQLSADAVKARKNAQDLGATYGVTSNKFKLAAAEANKLNAKLKQIDAATGNYQRSVGNYGNAMKGAIGFTKQMVSALGLMGGAFLAVQVIRGAAKTIKEFNKESAVLASILQKDVKEIKALTKNAKELGATTAKTANEVIQLQIAYARLGFTQQEIIDLTEATIEGSIAMNSSLEETADLVGSVVNSMDSLSTTDAPKIIDIMSLSTAKSALNFEKLSTQLPIVLGAANAVNVPFTKVVATLGKLSDAGIDASSAATSLRNIFIESAKRGINYEEALDTIRNSTTKLATANELFGKRAAVAALVIANNTDNVKELDLALQGAAGTAEEMATKQLDTLTGELTLANSAWDGFVLSIEDGEGAISKAGRSIVSTFSDVLNAITGINEVTDAIDMSQFVSIFDIPILSQGKRMAEASAFLKVLNDDFKELQNSDVDDLADSYADYTRRMEGASDVQKALIEFQLERIEELTVKRRALNIEEEKAADALFEQREGIIDVLLEVDKKLKYQDLEKMSLKDLTDLLNTYNQEEEKKQGYLKGSIGYLDQMISANNKLIEQSRDRSQIIKLQEENKLLGVQKQLLLHGERATASPVTGTAVGSVVQNDDPLNNLADTSGASFNQVDTTFGQELEGFMMDYGDHIYAAIDLTNTFFDNRIARIDEDIEKSNAYFESQIAMAEGNEEQQQRLERERQNAEAALLDKRRKEQRKQAIINKGVAIAEIAVNTAVAISKVLGQTGIFGLAAWIPVAALGAIQAATVLATPIPQFKEGTKAPLSKDTLAITGDGGKREPITKNGKLIGLSPDKPTLTMLPKGAEVHKDEETLMRKGGYDMNAIQEAAVMSSLASNTQKLNMFETKEWLNKALDKYQGRIKEEIQEGFSKVNLHTHNTIVLDGEYQRFINDTM